MFKKLLFLVVLIAVYTSVAMAQVPSPQPRCISVLPAPNLGGVTITWTTPLDPLSQFASYSIYRSSTFAGPYSLVAGMPIFVYGQTSFTDIGAGANTGIKYYYIQTTYNAPGPLVSPPVDTINTMFLNLPGGGSTANLSWNPIDIPAINSSSGTYNIYMEFPANVWTLTGSCTNLSYLDTIFACNATINYRIEETDANGCVSVSSVKGNAFSNTIPPAIPVMDTLSVNTNNHPMLNWNVNSAPDVAGYVVYQLNAGGAWVAVDTAWGINNVSYTYLGGNAGIDSLQYNVAAIDSCGNISPLGNANLQTIYLTSLADICNHSAILTWSAYPNIGSGLAGYRIYQATAVGGPYTYLGTVAPGVQTFTATSLITSTTYFFKVEAYDLSGHKSVSSNRRSFYCAAPIPPQFLYCESASVGGTNRVDVTAFVDTSASVLGYKIYRATNNSSNGYSEIGMIAPPNYPLIMYSDYTADASQQSYYYKVVAVDSCGSNGISSNIGRSINLRVAGNSDFTNTLTWNKYESWEGNVMAYHILRGIDGIINPTPIWTIIPDLSESYTYLDTTVWREPRGDGNFYYEIEAIEGAGVLFNFGATARSNIAVAKQEPEVFIPNAFTPDAGMNTTFAPVTVWAEYANYHFDIFDRFGENIFTSSKIGEAWNGSYHSGKNCETGVYVYLLKYRTAKGEDIQRKGIVTLIR